MKSRELLKLLKKDRWFEVSQEGSHIKLRNPTKTDTVMFPYHGAKEAGKGLKKAIKKQAGI
jgi:predicted RNA binding protein YcfA (HicA-like mRNA interferase family)